MFAFVRAGIDKKLDIQMYKDSLDFVVKGKILQMTNNMLPYTEENQKDIDEIMTFFNVRKMSNIANK